MLQSMTGFGSASGAVDGVEYSVEIRSVNNRYFKPVIKLPDSWSAAEADIEKILRNRVSRGTVVLSLRMRVPEEQAAYQVNGRTLNSYVDQLRSLETEANPTIRIDLAGLLELPGVLEPPPMEEIVARTRDGVMNLIDQAIEGLLDMRQKEGQALKDDLLGHCNAVGDALDQIAQRSPGVVGEYYERLRQRVEQLTREAKLTLDEETLSREVALFADRSDISEEVSRLRTHLEQFAQACDSSEPAGRKMDFIAQEMLREANTIASKSNDSQIGRLVVEIKSGIDRIKEQVQNVE